MSSAFCNQFFFMIFPTYDFPTYQISFTFLNSTATGQLISHMHDNHRPDPYVNERVVTYYVMVRLVLYATAHVLLRLALG